MCHDFRMSSRGNLKSQVNFCLNGLKLGNAERRFAFNWLNQCLPVLSSGAKTVQFSKRHPYSSSYFTKSLYHQPTHNQPSHLLAGEAFM
jgi:hypothetical protein